MRVLIEFSIGLLDVECCVMMRGRENDFLRWLFASVETKRGNERDVAGDRGPGVAMVVPDELLNVSWQISSE